MGGAAGCVAVEDARLRTHANAALHIEAETDPGLVVGTMRFELEVTLGQRVLVQLWYPAVESARAEAEAGRPVLDFEPEEHAACSCRVRCG